MEIKLAIVVIGALFMQGKVSATDGNDFLKTTEFYNTIWKQCAPESKECLCIDTCEDLLAEFTRLVTKMDKHIIMITEQMKNVRLGLNSSMPIMNEGEFERPALIKRYDGPPRARAFQATRNIKYISYLLNMMLIIKSENSPDISKEEILSKGSFNLLHPLEEHYLHPGFFLQSHKTLCKRGSLHTENIKEKNIEIDNNSKTKIKDGRKDEFIKVTIRRKEQAEVKPEAPAAEEKHNRVLLNTVKREGRRVPKCHVSIEKYCKPQELNISFGLFEIFLILIIVSYIASRFSRRALMKLDHMVAYGYYKGRRFAYHRHYADVYYDYGKEYNDYKDGLEMITGPLKSLIKRGASYFIIPEYDRTEVTVPTEVYTSLVNTLVSLNEVREGMCLAQNCSQTTRREER